MDDGPGKRAGAAPVTPERARAAPTARNPATPAAPPLRIARALRDDRLRHRGDPPPGATVGQRPDAGAGPGDQLYFRTMFVRDGDVL